MAKQTKKKTSSRSPKSTGIGSEKVTAGGYTVLARRYRSRDFDELIGQEPIARTLENAIKSGRTAHAYLFCGTRGVGKTSMARIFAKALNATDDLAQKDQIAEAILRGDDLDVIEIDGASNRGIADAKELIAGAGLSPARCPYKIYIIDEVHALTKDAFNALLKTMEEPPSHVKFILCTTESHKVPQTIQSRCQRFDFRPIPTAKIADQLRKILKAETIDADEEVIVHVAQLGNGSMRDALSLLDRLLAAGEPRLTSELLEQMIGLPDHALIIELTDAIIAGDGKLALEKGADLINRGSPVDQILELLAEHFRHLMILATCGEESALLELSPEAKKTASKQAAHFDAAGLVHLIAICDAVSRNARTSSAARALFDAALVRMAMSDHLADIPALIRGAPAADGAARTHAISGKKKALAESAVSRAPAQPSPTPSIAEVKPAPTAAVAPAQQQPQPETERTSPLTGEAIWQKLNEAAARSEAIRAKLDQFQYQSFHGSTLTLAPSGEGVQSEKFLHMQAEMLESVIRNETGRAIKISIEISSATPPAARSAAAAANTSADFDAARDIPAVRRAIEIFDASIISVTDAPSPETPH